MSSDLHASAEARLEAVQSQPERIESGLLLYDEDLQPIGSDPGALGIFRQHAAGSNTGGGLPSLPAEICEAIRRGRSSGRAAGTQVIIIGGHQYRCRFYIIKSAHPALAPEVIAVHLHSVTTNNNDDPVRRIVSIYRLTKREQEALRGIALGLTTKELADHMHVSPNTVKSFVRLITVKMGVSSRAEIMVRLLETSKEN
jgi:DNA-binding CsgD family transcriptional regulator